ncbi:hypothetical protein TWF730_008018 [Orbilia blumenaviensis]|uniref:Uncharacterized protein n=1 Tax=Orbilia blumenaviensis TaxID=1796055 RepID=A0AAV9V9L5_9PEZI
MQLLQKLVLFRISLSLVVITSSGKYAVSAVSGTGFLPVAEFAEWLEVPPNPQYLTEIAESLDNLTTKYFPPDPDYKPGTLPQTIQTILDKLHENLKSTELSKKDNQAFRPSFGNLANLRDDDLSQFANYFMNKNPAPIFSAESFFDEVLSVVNSQFVHREDMWKDRPLEKAALQPYHPSVYAALQEFCDYLRSNLNFYDTLTLGVWIYSGKITTRAKGDVAWYHLDSRGALSQLFGRFFTKLTDEYRRLKRLSEAIDDSLRRGGASNEEGDSKLLEPLLKFVKKVEQETYLVYWNMMTMRIRAETDEIAYNPGLNGKKPRRRPYNIDPGAV